MKITELRLFKLFSVKVDAASTTNAHSNADSVTKAEGDFTLYISSFLFTSRALTSQVQVALSDV